MGHCVFLEASTNELENLSVPGHNVRTLAHSIARVLLEAAMATSKPSKPSEKGSGSKSKKGASNGRSSE